MNAASSWSLWVNAIGLLAAEVAVVIALAFVLDNRYLSAVWRRTIWQISLVSLLVVIVAELSGLGRSWTAWATARPVSRPPAQMRSSVFVPGIDPRPAAAAESDSSVALPVDVSSDHSGELLLGALTGVWLCGVAGVMAWYSFGRWRLRRWRRRSLELTDQALLGMIRSLCHRFNFRGRLRVWESPGLTGPVAFGLFHPQLVLPVGFATDFSPAEQEVILAHELAHLSAYDPRWYGLADLTVALLWWHPLAWWARRRFQFTSECAADEASAVLKDGPERLAECLVKMGRRLVTPNEAGRLAVVGSGFRSALGQRVERLLAMDPVQERLVGRFPLGTCSRIAGPIILSLAVLGASGWMHTATSAPASLRQGWKTSPAGLMVAQLLPQTPVPAPPKAISEKDSSPLGERPFTSAEQIAAGESAVTKVPLATKWFKVDPNTLASRLREITVTPPETKEQSAGPETVEAIHQVIRTALLGVGVSLEPPRRVYYNNRLGMVMVRVTPDEMKLVDNLIGMITAPPPQLTIEVEMVKLPRDIAKQLLTDWHSWPNVVIQQTTAEAKPGPQKQIQWKAFLTDPQFRVTRRAWDQHRDVERVAFPKITTLSDRQVQLSSGNVVRAGTNLVIDLVPSVGADGYTIDLTAIVVTPEVLGYEVNEKIFDTIDRSVSSPPIASRTPRAVYAQAVAAGRVWDGQTMVVATEAGKDAPAATDQRTWLFFITPIVIDPAGNRVFTPDDLLFSNEWVPPQR